MKLPHALIRLRASTQVAQAGIARSHILCRFHASMADPTRKRSAVDDKKPVSPPPFRKRKIESATTKDAVYSFFTPASRKVNGKIAWTILNSTLLVAHFQPSSSVEGEPGREKRRKIAAFDLDSTLIRPASGKKYGKDADDWMWWHPSVPKRLIQLDGEGYQIVILSNQSGINLLKDSNTAKTDQKRLSDFKTKVGSALKQLDIYVSFYAATERDRYRKPRTGSWDEMKEYYDLDNDSTVDLENSFFVGDAGGRISESGGNGKDKEAKDFASSDVDFASNVGIKFHTPDEFFLGKPPRQFESSFQFNKYLGGSTGVPSQVARVNPQDIICLTGSPGAGKSTFYWNNLAPLGYERVNQDQLKTRDKCLEAAANYLQSGKSVVVDNTNADPETRAHWVKLAQRHSIPIRCVCLKSDPKLCEHNDAVRALNGSLMNPESRTRLPLMAFMSFAKRFRPPTLEEGFQDVVNVEFKFVGSKEQEAAWAQHYI